VRDRRARSEGAEETLHTESALRALEQRGMVREDRQTRLFEAFQYQTKARETRRQQAILDEMARHRAEAAAGSARRAEQLAASMRVQEGRLEVREREGMYLAEYQQRRVEWAVRAAESRGTAGEALRMLVEDQRAGSLRAAAGAAARQRDMLRAEADSVAAAQQEGMRRFGGDGGRLGRSIAERNKDAGEYRSHNQGDAASTASTPAALGAGLGSGDSGSGSEGGVCGRGAEQFRSLRPLLLPPMRLLCRIGGGGSNSNSGSGSGAGGETRGVLLRVSLVGEDRYQDLLAKLRLLCRAREVRRNDVRYLHETLAFFERNLARLAHLRRLNRTARFESRAARCAVLEEAVCVERRLAVLQSDADKYCMKLLAIGAEEAGLFEYLFVRGGRKDFEYAHSPQRFSRRAEEAPPAGGAWLQQKKPGTPLARRPASRGMPPPSPKTGGQSGQGKGKAGQGGQGQGGAIDSYYHETEEFLKTPRIAMDQVDRDYFSAVRDTPFQPPPPPQTYFLDVFGSGGPSGGGSGSGGGGGGGGSSKKSDGKVGTPSSKRKGGVGGAAAAAAAATAVADIDRKAEAARKKLIPGLSLFLSPQPAGYEFFPWAQAVLRWAALTAACMSEREGIWRRAYRGHCISFQQRMAYVTLTEQPLSTSSSAALLTPSDAAAPRAVDGADTLELYELLCCRAGLRLAGLEAATDAPFQLTVSSRDCEAWFGMHPFSLVGRFLYLEVCFYGFYVTVYDITFFA
jgi:hypothetical protein